MKTVKHLFKGKEQTIWWVTTEHSVYNALQLMAEKDIGALPDLRDERLTGIFSIRDVMDSIFFEQEDTIDRLEGHIQGPEF